MGAVSSFFLRYLQFVFLHCIGKTYDFFLYCGYLKYMVSNGWQVQYKLNHSTACIPTDRICIFVLYQPNGISKNTFKYLNAIRQQNFSIIAVSNCRVSDNDLASLDKICCQVILRDNIGRDFGAYKTGVLEIYRQNLPIKNLLIANDSVHAPLHDLSIMHEKMEAHDYDFWGVTDNFHQRYHIGSYYVFFNEKIVSSEKFKQFWLDFKDKNSRRHAIHKGEIALSSLLFKLGFHGGVFCSTKDILELIYKLEIKELIRFLFRFSRTFSFEVKHEEFNQVIRDLASLKKNNCSFSLLIVREKIALLVTWCLERTTQIHLAAIVFNNYFKLPLLKKDIVLRGVFDTGFLLKNIEITTDVCIEEISSSYLAKGTERSLSRASLQRYLLQAGYI